MELSVFSLFGGNAGKRVRCRALRFYLLHDIEFGFALSHSLPPFSCVGGCWKNGFIIVIMLSSIQNVRYSN